MPPQPDQGIDPFDRTVGGNLIPRGAHHRVERATQDDHPVYPLWQGGRAGKAVFQGLNENRWPGHEGDNCQSPDQGQQ